MKYTKAFLLVALAGGALAAAIALLRKEDAPTAPSEWIVQAATAVVATKSGPSVDC